MKKKQIIGIVVAGIVFVFVCLMSTFTRYVINTMNQMVDEILLTGNISVSLPTSPYIGVVNVEGMIQDTNSSWMNLDTYHHQETLTYIDGMIRSNTNRGILLCINSPGGYVYQTDELYLKLLEYKEKTKRPVWAYMEQTACSGGYYIAMASDKVYGNRNGMTGSIGVIMSMSNVTKLYDKLGIEEINITSGVNKAMGSSGSELTKEQREIYQSMVDESYEQFVEVVMEGRALDRANVRQLADGRVYTMKQASDVNLIDGVKTYKETEKEFLKEIGSNVGIFRLERKESSWLSGLLGKIAKGLPKSDTQVLHELLEEQRNGVLMYYAE